MNMLAPLPGAVTARWACDRSLSTKSHLMSHSSQQSVSPVALAPYLNGGDWASLQAIGCSFRGWASRPKRLTPTGFRDAAEQATGQWPSHRAQAVCVRASGPAALFGRREGTLSKRGCASSPDSVLLRVASSLGVVCSICLSSSQEHVARPGSSASQLPSSGPVQPA